MISFAPFNIAIDDRGLDIIAMNETLKVTEIGRFHHHINVILRFVSHMKDVVLSIRFFPLEGICEFLGPVFWNSELVDAIADIIFFRKREIIIKKVLLCTNHFLFYNILYRNSNN